MNGKPGIAPCGHPGEHVVGTYVQCKKCDAVPEHIERETTNEVTRCPRCGSSGVAEFWTLPAVQLHCWDCGHVF